ncbi:sugar transferase [Lacinutrix chionoecetis]
MTRSNKIIKRAIDIILSIFLLISLSWFIILLIILASLSTRSLGLFSQKRIGYLGKPFMLYKIRTMKKIPNKTSTVTTLNDSRITPLGRVLRRYKLDELPQLYNVLMAQMSFVGPRPDVEGFANTLKNEDRIILNVKPGITGPATLYFKNEETLLEKQTDPEAYSKNVLWPKKVAINKEYIKNYSIFKDIKYMFQTLFSV